MHHLNVGIVGGSLAGCSAAILLSRAGHRVRVFERSPGDLAGRVGGFRIPGALFAELVDRRLIDAGFPHTTCASMPFIARAPGHERFGRTPWRVPIDLKAFHWNALWRALRTRVPDVQYHRGVEAVGATTTAHGVTLAFADGSTTDFDLVLFADGANSLGRRLIVQDAELTYRGYMLWRGLRPESELEGREHLSACLSRLAFAGSPGHVVVYVLPSEAGSTEPGRRLIYWAAYLPLSESDIADFMIDREGTRREGLVPPGYIRPDLEEGLRRQTSEHLPDFYGDLVAGTRHTQVQLIYTRRMPAYHRGRVGVIGDAGVVAQPFTGSGVFKGYHNVTDLIDAIESAATLEEALDRWDREQVRRGNRLLALGEQMEQALIWNPPDLVSANATTVAAWWKGAVTFPRDFTYEVGI